MVLYGIVMFHKMFNVEILFSATKPGERILVAVSGGENSVGLVHMLHQGINTDQKKLLFIPVLCWIDEGCVFGLSEGVRKQNSKEIVNLLEQYGFDINIVHLDDFNNSDNEPINVFNDPDQIKYETKKSDVLKNTFNSLYDKSSREEFLVQSRRRILLNAARNIFSYNFTLTCSLL